MDRFRKKIEQLLLCHIAEAMSPQEAEKAKELFSSLSESEFTEMCVGALMLNGIVPEGTSPRELWEHIRALDSAEPKRQAIRALPREQALALLHAIDDTEPAGTAVLLYGEQKELAERCPEGDGPVSVIPAELFFEGTVPAPDIRLELDQTGQPNGEYMCFRVMLFSDYREQIAQAGSGNAAVGLLAACSDHDRCTLFVPLGIRVGEPGLLYGDPGFRTDEDEKNLIDNPLFSETDLREAIASVLRIWYGIQTTLLHPADDYLYFYLADCFGLPISDIPS